MGWVWWTENLCCICVNLLSCMLVPASACGSFVVGGLCRQMQAFLE